MQWCCPDCHTCVGKNSRERFTDKSVVDVTDDKMQINDGKRWILMIYAPWCGFCKIAMPDYEAFAKSCPVQVGRVDAVANPKLNKMFNVNGFPTFVMYQNGKVKVHEGGRKVEDLMVFSQDSM